MCYPVCDAYKRILAAHLVAAAGLFSPHLNDPLSYVRRYLTVNVLSASFNKTFPYFVFSVCCMSVCLSVSLFASTMGRSSVVERLLI